MGNEEIKGEYAICWVILLISSKKKQCINIYTFVIYLSVINW